MVAIATAAAVVASQALISGAFSLTRQAVQLGYSPRVTIIHTSTTEIGQIYIPEVNQALLVGCLALVAGFQSSSNLAAAYGIAVTGTMMITTLLFHTVACERWHWPVWRARALTLLFLIVDVAFFSANVVKITQGGWFPLVVAVAIYTLMTTWNRGRARSAVDFFTEPRGSPRSCGRTPSPWTSSSPTSAGGSPTVCPGPRCSSPPTPPARRPCCCITSSTTRCCTSG